MQTYANDKRRHVELSVGDWAYLKLRLYKQGTLAKHFNAKLAPRFVGPFQVEARVGNVANRLALPENARIHPVFHVSQLRKALGSTFSVTPFPPNMSPDFIFKIEPAELLGIR